MQIQVNSDNTVASHAPLVSHVESVVKEFLNRFSEKISRVEVHLSVINDHKNKGGEHHCLMEARMEGHPPIAAGANAESLHQAIHAAAEKLKKSIESTLGRIDDGARHRGGSPVDGGEPESAGDAED
jgi:ribosome-associated translation inhibitor RaiA